MNLYNLTPSHQLCTVNSNARIKLCVSLFSIASTFFQHKHSLPVDSLPLLPPPVVRRNVFSVFCGDRGEEKINSRRYFPASGRYASQPAAEQPSSRAAPKQRPPVDVTNARIKLLFAEENNVISTKRNKHFDLRKIHRKLLRIPCSVRWR